MSDLRATAHQAPAPLFAVVDGGRFRNAPQMLEDVDLMPRSLFLADEQSETSKAGPWLVAVDARSQIDALIDATMAEPASFVLWSCPAGDDVLYRHLRGINEAIVPLPPGEDDAIYSGTQGYVVGRGDYREERALFRHWDPRVLGLVLPILDEGQFTRVLGPASQIIIPSPEGSVSIAVAYDPPIVAQHGVLRLRVDQMAAISAQRVQKSRSRIAAYLADVAPHECRSLGQERIQALIRNSETTGKHMGLTTEQAFARWTYVMVKTNGRAVEQPGLLAYVRDGRTSADDKMYWLLKSISIMQRRVEAN